MQERKLRLEMDKSTKQILIFFFLVVVFSLMYVFSSILLPFVMAAIFAVLTHPLITFLRKLKFPKWLITPIIVLIAVSIIFGVYKLFESAVNDIASSWDGMALKFTEKVENLRLWLYNHLSLELPRLDREFIRDYWNLEFITKQFGDLATLLGSLAGSFSFFILYFFLFVSGISNIEKYLNHVEGNETGSKMYAYYQVMQSSITSYLVIKVLISAFTGLLTFIVCSFFELDFLIFIILVTFFLNFIPNIGSIIASFVPVIIGFIQFESFQEVILLAVLIVSIQIVMGNVIEPVVMGERNKINTITILIGLLFWGVIWGIPGMILSVPLLVIIKMLLEQFDSTATFARIMGSPEG
ncbi:MAG: AI-2E family transporter [Candidatus Kapaibacteriales bacterium]